MLTSLFYRKALSKSLPDIKILFLRLRNFEKQIRSNKKWKAPCHKAFHIRRAPLFDKTVRKAGLIHYGASSGTRTHTVSLPTDFESVTSTNSITLAFEYWLIIQDPPPKFKSLFRSLGIPPANPAGSSLFFLPIPFCFPAQLRPLAA